jgi:hypothetical protein
MPQSWDMRHIFYFPPMEGMFEDFYHTRKIQQLRPGSNTLTRVPEASMLTTRPPKPSSWSLEDGTEWASQNFGNYQFMLRNIQQEQRFQYRRFVHSTIEDLWVLWKLIQWNHILLKGLKSESKVLYTLASLILNLGTKWGLKFFHIFSTVFVQIE